MCVFPFIPCYKNEKCVSILQFIYKTEFPVCLIVVYMTAYVLQQLSFFHNNKRTSVKHNSLIFLFIC